jgi:hypothetical protein
MLESDLPPAIRGVKKHGLNQRSKVRRWSAQEQLFFKKVFFRSFQLTDADMSGY